MFSHRVLTLGGSEHYLSVQKATNPDRKIIIGLKKRGKEGENIELTSHCVGRFRKQGNAARGC